MLAAYFGSEAFSHCPCAAPARVGLKIAVLRRITEAMRPTTHAIIATVLLCAATVGYTHRMPEFRRFFAGVNDFLPLYTQARMVWTGQTYDVDAGYREQDRTVGFHISGAYHNRLPWQAVVMAPLAQSPYLPAFGLWISTNLACFAGLVRFWLLPRDYTLWGIVFLPAAASIIVGQDGLILALCLAAFLILANRGRDVSAGLLRALCTAKPHLFLLVPVALVAQRRWKIIVSAIAGTAGLLTLGTAAAGWDWVPKLTAIVTVLAQGSGLDVGRRPTLFQFGVNGATILLAALLAVAFSVVIWRARDLESGIAIAIMGSVLIAPHAFVYDLPVLLVALPALRLSRPGHWLRIALLTPVPYWALLRGSPWNAMLPLMLLTVTMASAWPLHRAARAAKALPPVRLDEPVHGR